MHTTTTSSRWRRRLSVAGIATATATLALLVPAGPAQADSVDYVATCSVGSLSQPYPFRLTGEVDPGPIVVDKPIQITGLTYTDDFAPGYRMAVVLLGTRVNLGLTADDGAGMASTPPIDVEIPGPDTPGEVAVAPTEIILAPPGFPPGEGEFTCPVTQSPGAIGSVTVEAEATTTTTTTTTSTTEPETTTTTSEPETTTTTSEPGTTTTTSEPGTTTTTSEPGTTSTTGDVGPTTTEATTTTSGGGGTGDGGTGPGGTATGPGSNGAGSGGPGVTDGQTLARTGSGTVPLALAGALLVAMGGATLMLRRRRVLAGD